MVSNRIILLGSFIVAVGLIVAQLLAPYRIAASVGTDGRPWVWRVNVVTGRLEGCYFVDENRISDNSFDRIGPPLKGDASAYGVECR